MTVDDKDTIDSRKVLAALAAMAPRAALGLAAEGLVHNLSGVAQAMAMQADLLAMTFAELKEKAGADPDLAGIVAARAATVERLTGKSAEMQRMLHAAAGLVFAGDDPAPAEPAELAAEAMDLAVCDMFLKHKVGREVEVAGGLSPVRAPRQALLMVLHELMKNSGEALAASGVAEPRLRLRCGQAGTCLRFEVEDNGRSAPLDREAIFAPFFTTRDGHAGIGLWLARHTAEMIGGRLSCERIGPDGALFVLEIERGGKG